MSLTFYCGINEKNETMYIRHATQADIPAIQAVARQHSKMLGFVRRASLERATGKGELYVACDSDQVAGFVNWHARRDGWSTIYEIAVDKAYQGQGVGRMLLYSVPCPIRLKCTQDNPANQFYANAGLTLAGVDPGRKRALNVYEMRLVAVLCAGNNRRFPEVALRSGMAYGARHDYQIRAWPYMLDIAWKSYDWQEYMSKVREYRPVAAMVADYEKPEQRDLMLAQVADLRSAGVLRIMACPKFAGAVADIPADCIVVVSIPTKYAGFIPDLGELKTRRLHLLGGSPVQQRSYIMRLQGAGAKVVSLDGNSHTKTASQGGYWMDGRWQFDREQFDYYELCRLSGVNIRRELNAAAAWTQPPLFR